MRDLRPLVEVAYVTPSGRLVTMHVSPDAVPIAKAHGWMALSDFEPPSTFNAPRIVHDDTEGDGA